ncbi:MAG: Fe-S oxidoreductase [Hyphomicrobium sp.]|nr:MAG: Fe-S oxidoreductase [Hyphomicrobium sp.]
MDTPCIKLCLIDQASGLCEGCGRTIPEITAWASLSDIERRAVMAELPLRLASRVTRPAMAGAACGAERGNGKRN